MYPSQRWDVFSPLPQSWSPWFYSLHCCRLSAAHPPHAIPDATHITEQHKKYGVCWLFRVIEIPSSGLSNTVCKSEFYVSCLKTSPKWKKNKASQVVDFFFQCYPRAKRTEHYLNKGRYLVWFTIYYRLNAQTCWELQISL